MQPKTIYILERENENEEMSEKISDFIQKKNKHKTSFIEQIHAETFMIINKTTKTILFFFFKFNKH